MAYTATTKQRVIVSAVKIHADGTREDLGVIADSGKRKSFMQILKGLVTRHG